MLARTTGGFASRESRPMRWAVVLGVVSSLGWAAAHAEAQVSGAVFTTDAECTGVDLNIYASKDDVYLDGGPRKAGAAGLPDGGYCVRVTDPSGQNVLGTSALGAVNVTDGEFDECYQLSVIAEYDDTPNPGGEYKVWVSTSCDFLPNETKTDNFKVRSDDGGGGPAETSTLEVIKFYDANADGIHDEEEVELDGWRVRIADGITLFRFTPVSVEVEPDDYLVTECTPEQSNWLPTTPNPVSVTLEAGDTELVEFGNVCLGAGGGRTLGFWSNKNGQSLFNDGNDLQVMVALNLRNASGAHFDPANYAAFRTWLLGANATNMAYMLSAQLAAMRLNVLNGLVDGDALIFAPGATGANAAGFITVNALLAEADASLGTNGNTVAAGPVRTYQEALKNALDAGNNNQNFVQAEACEKTFDETDLCGGEEEEGGGES